MKTYKPLPKNPLVQRMEDVHIPGMKKKAKHNKLVHKDTQAVFDELPKDVQKEMLEMVKAIRKDMDNREGRATKLKREHERLEYSIEKPNVVVKFDVPPAPYRNDKVIWEGREWLRSVNDPHHGRHVMIVLVLIVALLFAGIVLL